MSFHVTTCINRDENRKISIKGKELDVKRKEKEERRKKKKASLLGSGVVREYIPK